MSEVVHKYIERAGEIEIVSVNVVRGVPHWINVDGINVEMDADLLQEVFEIISVAMAKQFGNRTRKIDFAIRIKHLEQ